MKFGYYGREDGCLISVFQKKGIDVKILQRQFTFSVNPHFISLLNNSSID